MHHESPPDSVYKIDYHIKTANIMTTIKDKVRRNESGRMLSVSCRSLLTLVLSALPACGGLLSAQELQTDEETTAAISVITTGHTDHRSAKNIGNSILGQGLGLVSLQDATGRYASQNPTFYVRGLQTLNGNNAPLILVDGIERDITTVTPEEVEQVNILKDAAAVALYGYKGINGVVDIITKRGKEESMGISVTYDHLFNFMSCRPKMADAAMYAAAINEARLNDGLPPRYNDNELAAISSGAYPTLYPNVDWADETFRTAAATNKLNIEFRGGTKAFRYYAMMDLISDKGFIGNANSNDGYSTQDKYSKGNLRMNLDIDLTPTTLVKVNILGSLAETTGPGAQTDLWDLVYSIPATAFPVRDANGTWAGSDTWAGTLNPVAQAQGAAYYRNHTRTLFSDITLRQDLSALTRGLSVSLRAGYDNTANIYEDHSKTYVYTVTTPTFTGSEPESTVNYYGEDTEMGSTAKVDAFSRRLHVDIGADYARNFGRHYLHSRLGWDYEYEDPDGINNTVYRHNISWWTHYAYDRRYIAELALVESGSSRLAPDTKWNFSPTVSAAWVVSSEKWMKPLGWLDRFKLRASFGIINADYLPGDNVWTYYTQQYQTSGTAYPFGSGWTTEFRTTYLGQIATTNPAHEKARKLNVGIDASLWGTLSISADVYTQRRSDIWVDASGKFSEVVGNPAPYENAGIVDSWGIEIGADYNKRIGQVDVNVGANFNLNRNEIVEQLEEPRLYDNLVQTGNAIGQIYGLKAIGLFRDEADIESSPKQMFSTVRPGDIKYEDVNGDNVIDANDKVKLGYSSTAPEIYYNIHLGAEYKGLGFYALLQGTGRYSCVLNTKSVYYPLVGNTTISEYYYLNRWTPDNTAAKYPRLSSQNNANNYQANTVFLADRSYLKVRDLEIYYRLPAALLEKTRLIKGAKLYVRGNDLLSFDSFDIGDPEAYGLYPLTKSVAIGASLTF